MNQVTPTAKTASVEELRAFLDGMKEKSPEEVLGLPTKSQLPGLTVAAGALTVMLVFCLTGVAFVFGFGTPKPTEPTAAKPVAPVATPEATVEPVDAQANMPEATGDDASAADQAVEAMGIAETKEADPNTNPLESEIDNLLKGIE